MDKSNLRKKIIGLFTGIEFEIRRARLIDCIREVGSLPNLANPSIQAQLKQFATDVSQKGDDPEFEQRMTRMLLEKGVVSPKIWFGDDEKCPEDGVCVADLGSDADYVAGQVATFSFDMPGLRSLDTFFRGPGAGVARSSGEEIRAEAVCDAGNGGLVEDGEVGIRSERSIEGSDGRNRSNEGQTTGPDNQPVSG